MSATKRSFMGAGLFCAVCAAALLVKSDTVEGMQQVEPAECYDVAACGGMFCTPAPTSLPAVNTNVNDPDGWTHSGGNCGIVRFGILLPIPCGPPLASGACIGGPTP